MLRNLAICLLLFLKNCKAQDESIYCTAKTCSDYITTNPCSSLPDNCNIQNSTHNGLFLPSPDICNCCQYCLDNLKKGDYCANGEAGGLVPDSICGPGLYCNNGVCEDLSIGSNELSKCSVAQGDYDQRRNDGTLGFMELRPNCDDNGFYQSYKCVPGQTCFCIDKEGNRIFGEIAYTSTANLILKCECSRKFHDIRKFFDRDLYPQEHFRCVETGDYDTIQCIGNDCMCTDALDGAPTFPSQKSVNISDISSETLKDCFKKDVHLTGKYYYACTEKYMAILEDVEESKSEGDYDAVFGSVFPNCDLDGKYAAVQTKKDGNDTYYICVEPDGTPIESYTELVEEGKEIINCKCAKSVLLLPEDSLEKPQCCSNGNFNPVQCRRGKCYCVDEDGYQDVTNTDETKTIEADFDEIQNLFCYDARCADPEFVQI